MTNNKHIHKRSTALERPVKIFFTGGLKLVLWYQPHPYFRCGSRQIDVCFSRNILNLSMYHILLNTDRDIKKEIDYNLGRQTWLLYTRDLCYVINGK